MKSVLKTFAAALGAVALSFAPGMTGVAGATTDYRQQVIRNLEIQHADSAAAGYAREPRRGDWMVMLQAGQGQELRIRLAAGKSYQIVGACDQDCTDVDLSVRNAAGQFVGSDYSLDDHPVVNIRPAFDQTYVVRMSMAACSHEPCFAAARVLSR